MYILHILHILYIVYIPKIDMRKRNPSQKYKYMYATPKIGLHSQSMEAKRPNKISQ